MLATSLFTYLLLILLIQIILVSSVEGEEPVLGRKKKSGRGSVKNGSDVPIPPRVITVLVWIYLFLGAGFLHVTDLGPLGLVMRWWGGVRMIYQLSPVQFSDSDGKKMQQMEIACKFPFAGQMDLYIIKIWPSVSDFWLKILLEDNVSCSLPSLDRI